jgi:hypothetical protein
MSKNSTRDTDILGRKNEEMEKSLVELEKLIDDFKKQCEKEVVKTLEVFRLTTNQGIKRNIKKLENLCKKNN